MTRYGSATAIAAAMCGMMGSAAAADVTPTEVWEDWTAYMTDFGFAVTATEARDGDSLTQTDIVMRFEGPEDGADTEVTMPELSLVDNGDGTVSIVFPDRMPISVAVGGDAPVSFDMIYDTSDMDMTVSGDASEMVYDYAASSVGMTLENFVAEGEPVDLGKAAVTLKDVEGRTIASGDTLRRSVQNITSGPMTYEFAFQDPEASGNSMAMKGGVESLAMTGTAALPTDMDLEDMGAALNAGFAVAGEYTLGAGASTFEMIEDGVTTKGSSSSSGSMLTLRMDSDALEYGGATNDLAVEVMSDDLPFPVAMGMQEAEFGLTMPIAQKEAPQDFGLTFVLGDLTVSETIWALIDPEGKLPHDPATLALELAGKARIMADLMDPAQMAKVEEGEEMPAELDALTLKRLLLRIAGAELTGEGDVTFDNTDTEAYGGMPKPIGDVGLKLTGGNTLLDTLVGMGLLPEEQVMGVRMMMGVFATPVEGEDELNSKIEFTEDGQILANGQRLK